jgi:ABC-type nitrate/sulfonate/bicarbonate transport system substrate-binding protein
MKHSQCSAWIYSLLLVPFLAAQSTYAAADRVRIAAPPSLMSLPVYVATERGFFEKYKVKPQLIECSSGQDCMKALGQGEADIAISSELPVMFAAYEHNPISVLATMVTNKDDLKFLASRNLLSGGQLNLVGKRIGYVPKSSSHYYMDIFLLFKGIDPQDVLKVPMSDSKALTQALLEGDVDAISIWEPEADQVLHQGGGEVVKVDAPRLYTQTFNVSVHNQFKHRQKGDVHGVVKALGEAVDYICNYPSRAKAAALRNNLARQEYLEKNWHEYTFRMTLQQSLVSTLQGQARWAQREGHIQAVASNTPEYLNYIDAMFLREHKSAHVDFVYR